MSRILTVCTRAYGEFPTRIVNFINIAGVLLILTTISRPGNLHGNFIKSVHFMGNLNKLTMSLAIFFIDEHYLHGGYNRYIMLFFAMFLSLAFKTPLYMLCLIAILGCSLRFLHEKTSKP